MKRSTLSRFLAATLCSFALTGTAMAQQQNEGKQPQNEGKQQQNGGKQPQNQGAQVPPPAGIIPLGITVAETAVVAPGYRATKLVRADVYNDQDQKIGKIGDLVIAPDGTLSIAVVDVGGFVGIAKHRVAIPVRKFTQIHPKIILPGATKEELKKMPEFVPV